MKTEIYNLIILDESGSMSHVKRQTVSGCNETINTIRSAQEKFADTQTHYVSIYAFQANDKIPSRYLIKNQPLQLCRISATSSITHGEALRYMMLWAELLPTSKPWSKTRRWPSAA